MLQFLLDTDHLTLFEHGHPPLKQHLAAHAPWAVGLTVVTLEESLRGRLAAIAKAPDGPARIARYALLQGSLERFQLFPSAPFDQGAEDHFQKLLAMRLHVGSRDLKIAAIALANQLILVTRNRQDFGRIPGLVLEDWSV
jgi:tRNA(fMet)-specific endonuclease VapC